MDAACRPAWPERVLSLAGELNGAGRAEARGKFWLLLNLALAQRLRLHCRCLGWIERERIHDLASEKTLDLIGKFDCGHWKPLDSSTGELVNFISTVARNALVDELRRTGRFRTELTDAIHDLYRPAHKNPDMPGFLVERKEFISNLVTCTDRLKPQHRVIWLFRVLYEMPSKSIANHPEVLLKASHVDMILNRCRNQIRRCMRSKGLEAQVLPPGTYAELWKTFRFETSPFEPAHD